MLNSSDSHVFCSHVSTNYTGGASKILYTVNEIASYNAGMIIRSMISL